VNTSFSQITDLPKCLEKVPLKYLSRVTEKIPACPPLDITVAGSYIHDENYWKRCAIYDRGWKNCDINDHGMMWKQLYFEKYLQDELEAFDPATSTAVSLAYFPSMSTICVMDTVLTISLDTTTVFNKPTGRPSLKNQSGGRLCI
jgi:hypothetical protein